MVFTGIEICFRLFSWPETLPNGIKTIGIDQTVQISVRFVTVRRTSIITGTDKGIVKPSRRESPVRIEDDARPGEYESISWFKIWRKRVHPDNVVILEMRFPLEHMIIDVLALQKDGEVGLGCGITNKHEMTVQASRLNSPKLSTGIWELPLGLKLIVTPSAWDKEPETVLDFTGEEE